MFAVPVLLWVLTIFYAVVESGVTLIGHCRLTTIGALTGRGPACAGADLAPAGAGQGSVAEGIVGYARNQIGKPYAWGAPASCSGSPAAFDCSGLTKCAVEHATGGRVRLSHYTVTQLAELADVPVGKDIASWQPGDLVYYFVPTDYPVEPGHTAIYVGGGQVIHAPHRGTTVQQGSADMGPGTYVLGVRRPAARKGLAPTGGGVQVRHLPATAPTQRKKAA